MTGTCAICGRRLSFGCIHTANGGGAYGPDVRLQGLAIKFRLRDAADDDHASDDLIDIGRAMADAILAD